MGLANGVEFPPQIIFRNSTSTNNAAASLDRPNAVRWISVDHLHQLGEPVPKVCLLQRCFFIVVLEFSTKPGTTGTTEPRVSFTAVACVVAVSVPCTNMHQPLLLNKGWSNGHARKFAETLFKPSDWPRAIKGLQLRTHGNTAS